MSHIFKLLVLMAFGFGFGLPINLAIAADENVTNSVFSTKDFVLKSKNLALKPLKDDVDRQIAFSMLVQSGLSPMSTLFNIKPKKDASLVLGQMLNWILEDYLSFDSNDEIQFLAFDSHHPVGFIALEGLSEEGALGVDASVFVPPHLQNKGYASEITAAILKWLIKEHQQISYIETAVCQKNIPSIRLCERIGMRSIREATQYFIKDQRIDDIYSSADLPLELESQNVFIFRIELQER